jgi:hypothetical protein
MYINSNNLRINGDISLKKQKTTQVAWFFAFLNSR